jgi:hypothetical protein
MKTYIPPYADIIHNAWDLNEHSIDNSNRRHDSFIVARQPDAQFGYFNTNQFALTSSNNFVGNQTINGNLNIDGDIIANQFLVTTMSVTHYSASTNFGLDSNDTHRFTGSLFISGATEFGGDLVPKEARGATLGTLERPFREIYVSSGSINIASDVIGDPNTTLSNIGGNILVSAGGMRLLGDASFIAATGSFQYISGSMTQVGDYTQTGDYVMVGDKTISGSISVSGSLYMNGNKQFNYGQFCDLTIQSGSANTAYPMKLNTTDVSNGVSVVSGSFIKVANTGTYNLQFSAQLEQTVNEVAEVSIWLRKDGTNVANSNTEISIEKSGKLVAAWNYVVQLNTNQYVELVWASTSSNTQLHYHTTQSTPTRPATPSVIATLTQIA